MDFTRRRRIGETKSPLVENRGVKMNITNKEFEAIEKALELLPHGKTFIGLNEETQNIILNADKAMLNLMKKKEKDNKRTAKYIAEKRKTNPNYAR